MMDAYYVNEIVVLVVNNANVDESGFIFYFLLCERRTEPYTLKMTNQTFTHRKFHKVVYFGESCRVRL